MRQTSYLLCSQGALFYALEDINQLNCFFIFMYGGTLLAINNGFIEDYFTIRRFRYNKFQEQFLKNIQFVQSVAKSSKKTDQNTIIDIPSTQEIKDEETSILYERATYLKDFCIRIIGNQQFSKFKADYENFDYQSKTQPSKLSFMFGSLIYGAMLLTGLVIWYNLLSVHKTLQFLNTKYPDEARAHTDYIHNSGQYHDSLIYKFGTIVQTFGANLFIEESTNFIPGRLSSIPLLPIDMKELESIQSRDLLIEKITEIKRKMLSNYIFCYILLPICAL